MGKRHIARMMAVETILTAGISILGGLVFGIIFGKLMYLLLLKILHNSVDMQFSVNGTAIVQTVILFAGIFLLTYLYNILQIQLVNPVEITCLRGITWCAMAWVQYQQPDKLIINESTYRKLEDYLSDGFLEKIEIFLEQ